MTERDAEHSDSPVDRAISDRLAKLRTMPVDTSRLEQMLRAQIPLPEKHEAGERRLRHRWFRPLTAAASFLLVIALVAALLTSSTGPVLASPTQMAQMHEELVSGRTAVMQVDSIDAANKALASQWPESPAVPNVPRDHVMACCMKSVKNKKVACVLLKSENVPVTMTVANAADMKLPRSPTVTRGGVIYHVQSAGKLNMVMTERHERWVCLIGQMPADRLMDMADKLQF